MFNFFKRKTQLDLITKQFNEEDIVKQQCDATIHNALFARYLTVTRMTALAHWAKMTDEEKLLACNIQPEDVPVAEPVSKKRLVETDRKKMVIVDESHGGWVDQTFSNTKLAP